MKDPKNRDFFTRLYRLAEKYEVVPEFEYADDAARWFSEAYNDAKSLYAESSGSIFKGLCLGLYQSLEEAFKSVNAERIPLKERPKEPEQMMLF